MINKTIASILVLSIGLVGCSENGQNNNKQEEEVVENPASQTIPKEAEGLLGRWDLTLDMDGSPAPGWLEVSLSGFSTLVGNFVSYTGSARPVSHIKLDGNTFSFAIPPQWEGGAGDFVVEGEFAEGAIKGTLTSNKGKSYSFTGVPAPYLVRESQPEWGEEVELFNGEDLSGWNLSSDKENWVVEDGILVCKEAGANLISEDTFDDFKLIAEFRYPEGSNSGIYLRGRYEVQIEDSPLDKHPGSLFFGGIYGFLSPNRMATLGPNEWQKFEITLVGRLVTIVANGHTIISEQEIPGITGGALDSNEGERGPIYLQGDHGPIEFRKLAIIPAKN